MGKITRGQLKMKKMSLGAKMTVGGVLMVIIPLIFVGWFAVIKANDGLENLAHHQAEALAQKLADMTEMVLQEELKTARSIAANSVVVQTSSQLASLGDQATDAMALDKELNKAMKEMGQDYEALLVIDTKGKVFAQSVEGYRGIDLSQRDYFQKAVNGETCVGDVAKSKGTGRPITGIAAPVKDSSGRIVAVYAAVLKVDFLVDKIASTKIGNTGYAWMVNKKGLTIAHPKTEYILELNLKDDTGGEMADIMNKMLSGQAGVEAYVFKGVPKICGFAPVPLTGWALGATQDEEEFLAPVRAIRNGVAMIGGVVLAIAIVLVLLFARSVSKPIMKAVESLGDGSEQVASAATQVSSSAQSLAEGSSEQAAALEETSASMEEMLSQTKANADNAAQADQLMAAAKEVLNKAAGSMEQMGLSMGKIAESGDEIGKIVKSIDEISFQTNLLALNAAVEAARAGDAGMGFAVVADEVRNLAQRAADAAKNTQELVEDTVKRIHEGSELVTRTQDEFNQVATSAGKVAELVSEIAAASSEQSQGIDQVNEAVRQMDQVVQESAAGSEESASAAEELNALAISMQDTVEDLIGLVNGAGNGNGNGNGQRRALAAPAAKQFSKTQSKGANNGKSKLSLPAAKMKKQQVAKAEQIIPLDDSDFSDF
jgi:methyl-accepting chemotaxis protein